MKWGIITLLLILCIKSKAQLNVEDSLCAVEYSYFKSENDSIKNSLVQNKIDLMIRNGIYSSRLLYEFKRYKSAFISDSILLEKMLWNGSLAFYLNQEYEFANSYFDSYSDLKDGLSPNAEVLGLLIKSEIDSSTFNMHLEKIEMEDSLRTCFECLMDVRYYVLKNKKAYSLTSTVFPGFGSLMTGDVVDGVGSLVTLGGGGYGVYKMWTGGLYFNAVSWGVMLLPRLYFGGIGLSTDNAQKLEDKRKSRLSENCKAIYRPVLKSHPITFMY